METMVLDQAACRTRQARLLEVMREQDVAWVVVQRHENVQWLTGQRLPWSMSGLAALAADGRMVLVVPESCRSEGVAADEVIDYAAQPLCTMRNDQLAAAADVLRDVVAPRIGAGRVGLEFSVATRHLDWPAGAPYDIEPQLYRLRRRKEPDELALIRRAIAATEAMYARAREMIEPGIDELTLFNALQTAAVESCGEMLSGTGNDYQCGSPGGAPRAGRRAEAGELYILDLGPAYRGYFADNARTIAVTQPTDMQFEAWRRVTSVFPVIESSVRPGVSARQLFEQIRDELAAAPLGTFPHHLGHGIGLFPHEAPHLNDFWDDTFEVGDVFTVEPGLYDPALRAGLRIENDYVVTESGVECLTRFPLDL